MAEAGGPTNITPSFSQSSANSGFSDKKPYPGWIAYIQTMIIILLLTCTSRSQGMDGGLMVNALTSRLSSLDSNPGCQDIVLCACTSHYSHSAFPPRCINETSKFNAVGWLWDVLASFPWGSRNIPSHFMLLTLEISTAKRASSLACRFFLASNYAHRLNQVIWNILFDIECESSCIILFLNQSHCIVVCCT